MRSIATIAGDTLFIDATMTAHGIQSLVTQNQDDVVRFDEIDILSLINLVQV